MDRIEYELGVIDKMGYSSYIDIVEDFINYSKRNFGDESIGLAVAPVPAASSAIWSASPTSTLFDTTLFLSDS